MFAQCKRFFQAAPDSSRVLYCRLKNAKLSNLRRLPPEAGRTVRAELAEQIGVPHQTSAIGSAAGASRAPKCWLQWPKLWALPSRNCWESPSPGGSSATGQDAAAL